MFRRLRVQSSAVGISLSPCALAIFGVVLLVSCGRKSPAALQRPTVEELKTLFPKFAYGLKYSEDKLANLAVGSYAGQVDEVKLCDLATTVLSDVDGDGTREFSFIATWISPVVGLKEGKTEFLLGILKRTEKGWSILHQRHSGDKNDVGSALIRAVPYGIEVYVFEARGQCDDEKLESYAIKWDPHKKVMAAQFSGEDLHPFDRNWDCGE